MENLVTTSNDDIRVSLCLPVFNVEKTIGETLESIIQQSHQNFNLKILDNHSTDKTVDICRKFVKTDTRLQLIRHSENLGWGANFNQSIELLDGDFGCIIHGDDVYGKKFIEHNLKASKTFESALIFTRGTRFKKRIPNIREKENIKLRRIAHTKDQFIEFLINRGNLLYCPTAFMSVVNWQSLVKEFKFREFGGGADLDAWLRVATNMHIYEIQNQRNFYYRLSEQQISHIDKMNKDRCVFVQTMLAHVDQKYETLLKIHSLSHEINSSTLSYRAILPQILRVLYLPGSLRLKLSCIYRIFLNVFTIKITKFN